MISSSASKGAIKSRAWRAANLERRLALERGYRERNREKINAQARARYLKNPKIKEYQQGWRKDNPGKSTEYTNRWKAKNPDWQKTYNKEHKESLSAWRRGYEKDKVKTDPIYMLKKNMRVRITHEVKKFGAKKSDTIVNLVGPMSELKAYIEKQFKPGMTWQNHGDWHIDHIIPLSIFNLKHYEEQEVAFHYTNLQPLWRAENLSKSNSMQDLIGART